MSKTDDALVKAKAAEEDAARALYDRAKACAAEATALRKELSAFAPEFSSAEAIKSQSLRELNGNVRPARADRIAARKSKTEG